MISQALSGIDYLLGSDRCLLREDDVNSRDVSVEFDAVLSESWGLNASLSNNEVNRNGSANNTKSSFYRLSSEIINLQVILSNHTGLNPLNPKSLVDGLFQDTVKERLDILHNWINKGKQLNYFGATRESLTGFVITSLTPSKKALTGDGVELSIVLTKLKKPLKANQSMIDEVSRRSTVRKGLSAAKQLSVAAVTAANMFLLGGE